MKKILLSVFCVLGAVGMLAAEPGFGTREYRLTVMGEYSYNKTWGHHGNLDVQSLLPFNDYFEMEAKVQLSSANVYSGALQFRPKFELPVGEMFIETDLYYRAVVRNQLGDLTAALGVGYRMDYVSVTLGMYGRVFDDWKRDRHTNETYVVEPFNLLYRVEVFCRPQDNNWNLSFLFSNIDDYQMERMWQPLFGVGAWCDLGDNWRLVFGAQCKPTGMFHLDATFYGATFRTGFTYRF
ncbi:MAG: hypothetical protein IJQ84_01840 [Paludibacteraceae bacterium]|nr:hypothetical protein [Paludibacteraceae bacterium]